MYVIGRMVAAGCVALAACGGSCNGGGGAPPPDSCEDLDRDAAEVVVDALAVGSGQEDEFVPFADQQVVERIFGSQGGAMIPVVLSLSGDSVPGCIRQDTRLVTALGNNAAREQSALKTYPQSDGSRQTKRVWLVLRYVGRGDAVTLVTEAGTQRFERILHLDLISPDAGPLDAGMDAQGGDATDAAAE